MENKLLLIKSAVVWVNEYYQMEDHVLLKVFRKDLSESHNVLIDTEDFGKVSKGQWYVVIQKEKENHKECVNVVWTSSLNGKKVNYQIYQFILDTKETGLVVDHIDMNRLNNRRNNLRIATCQINSINQIHKGYNYDKITDKYLVRTTVTIGKKRKAVNLGRYSTELEAEIMYLKANIILGNDKICTNIAERIKELNISLIEKDYENKYIQKLILLRDGKCESSPKELNSRYNLKYDENMELIDKLRNEGLSYYAIEKYLRENIEGLSNAKDETIKKKYENYLSLKQKQINI